MNRDILPLTLVVLDGWGEAPPSVGNAASNCNPERMNALRAAYPTTLLAASGEAVGLPPGQIGNSEVGHLCLGAGRVVLQDLPRINRAIETGEFRRNDVLIRAMDGAVAAGRTVHLIGLLSPGGVHSHVNHLRALVEMAHERAARISIHAFLDGRDVPPKSAQDLMRAFEPTLAASGAARIATVAGRFYAMDRDNRWERVERAWVALVRGEGIPVSSGVEAIERGYARGETDEFIQPSVVTVGGRAVSRIEDGDAVIHFNFRADRARELTRSLAGAEFPQFERKPLPRLSAYVCFTEYDKTFALPVAFPASAPERVFGEVISSAGLSQVRMAETEKYAHVTYFFNGGGERPFEREERVLVPSTRKVATYDLQPEMSAPALTEEVLRRIRGGADDFLLVNFANPDMVGHTGVYEAAVVACKLVDECVGRIASEALAAGGALVVTADHGNCEQMIDPVTKGPHTAHTTNPVACMLACESLRGRGLRSNGMLSDVIPTLLELMEIEQPVEMSGASLLR